LFFAIIVTYTPDINHVKSMVHPLVDENIKVVLYDNTPSSYDLSSINHQSIYKLGDGNNKGLSVAYNDSIKFIESKYEKDEIEGFLFYDQDSTITTENIQGLISEYDFLKENNIPVGLLGARPINKEGKFYGVHKIKNQQYFPDRFIEIEFVISSFSLVPYLTIQKIGYFDEKLFIDLVDSEFSFRCTKFGLLNLMSKKVLFTHEVGERKGTLLGLKSFAISSPIRNYYQARNLILVGRDYGWYGFIVKKVSKRFIQVLLSAYYNGDLFKRLNYFFKGIKDGIKYKGGRIDE
jgi:rhamnosyltransferase